VEQIVQKINKNGCKFRGVQYMLSMMRKCIMVKVGEAKQNKENDDKKKFTHFA